MPIRIHATPATAQPTAGDTIDPDAITNATPATTNMFAVAVLDTSFLAKIAGVHHAPILVSTRSKQV
jgi:ABC-type amino acid transport system permease subunit